MNALSLESEPVEPAPPRPARGWFLPRHNVRVIDRGDVYVVEFADRPWYTEATRRRELRQLRLSALLQAFHLL